MILPIGFNPSKSPIQFDSSVLKWMGIGGYLLASSQEKAQKKQQAAIDAANQKSQEAINNTPQVDSSSAKAARLGRAALIQTSPLGIQTTEPTGRRKLLGN